MRNILEVGSPAVRQDSQRFVEVVLSMGRRRRGLRDPFFMGSEQLGLTAAQFHAVLWLGLEVRLTMGELAQRMGVTEKTVTGMVDRLESSNLARRERDETDRRVVRVLLTDPGLEAFGAVQRGFMARVDHLLGLLEPAERESLLSILEKLSERFGAAAPAGAHEEVP